jgi:crotonobetainyl-CoA:carnitine CoA-transferase CaiB-like acyl-CoA transferase
VPFQIAGADIGPRGPAPRVGQHTEALLLAAGYAPDEVERLLTEGVVADASAPPPERQHEEADQVS